ncbi:hypothetical protein [Bathymodiolus japonicus methanotrophic gill symbiont]|uniref:hypothetical protein n=1 Tax=Bathymodiolus japonicus methanotrophic gill symbiont TaxID=113269 RepID=UPI001C8E4229|nr:hypothetical protein [Bathymodiolus japonicus methanotrophic gill symbiont]
MIKSFAQYIEIDFLEFPDFLKTASSYHALTADVFEHSFFGKQVLCLSKTLYDEQDREHEYSAAEDKPLYITRSKAFLSPRFNPINGLVILDIDDSGEGELTPPAEMYKILCQLIPGFESVLCFSQGSSSSRVKGFNKNGYRFYFPSSTPTLIPGFIKALARRLVDYQASIETTLEVGDPIRQPVSIDTAMASAVQLDYCGTPVVSDDVELEDVKVVWHQCSGQALDCDCFGDLEVIEKGVSNGYVFDQHQVGQGNQLSESEDDIQALNFDRPLYFGQGDTTVESVLKSPKRYDKKQLADPIEGPGYRSGRTCAVFYANGRDSDNQGPQIYSQAHGGQLYSLVRPAFPEKKAVLPVNDACAVLNEAVFNFFKAVDNPKLVPEFYGERSLTQVLQDKRIGSLAVPNTVIAATAGLGKTRAIFKAAAEMKAAGRPLFVHLYVPRHKLAGELKKDMMERFPGLNIEVRKGRRVEGMCANYDQVKLYENIVPSVTQAFCSNAGKQCQFFENCAYLKQFDTSADVLILAQHYLNTFLSKSEKRPDLVVIDERYYDVITGHNKYAAKQLKAALSFAGVRALHEAFSHCPANNAQLVWQWEQCLIEAGTQNTLDSEKASLAAFVRDYEAQCMSENNEVVPGDSPAKLKYKLAYINDNREDYRFASILLRICQDNSDASHFSCIQGQFVIHQGLYTKSLTRQGSENNLGDKLSRLGADRYTQFLLKVPILCIDGDASEILAQDLLKRPNASYPPINFIQINAQRRLCVTQCHSKVFGKNSLNGSDIKILQALAKIINRTAASNYAVYKEPTLLVTYLGLEENKKFTELLEHLEISEKGKGYLAIAHFNDTRGINQYSNYHCIILGRNQMSGMDALLQSEDLSKDPNKVRIRSRKGDEFNVLQLKAYQAGKGVDRERSRGKGRYFNNPYTDAILAQTREHEITQAIARIRDVRSPHHKQVLILGSLAIDLKIDRVVTWQELDVKNQQTDVINCYTQHDGRFLRAAKVLSELDDSCSQDGWANRIKNDNKQYILPMSEWDIQCCKALSDASKPGEEINFNQHLFPEIKALKDIKIPGKNHTYRVNYDADRHTEESVVTWVAEILEGIK